MTGDERLVDGVLLPGFTGAAVPDWLARAADGGLAGVCVFAPNVGPGFPALTRALHDRAPGFLVASDEEGGAVTRIEHLSGSSWPGGAALGRLDDPAVTAAVATAMGAQCRAAGVDLALAPVADVNAEPDNPVIGVRAFGATPDLVARHTAAFVRGMQAAGTAASAKHFPGHGSTTVDSHKALPRLDADLATLRARDLPPFAAAVEAGVRTVMTAHVLFPALDDRPATMSPRLLGLLRADLGFDGVVISDAVDMQAISGTVGMGPGAAAAVAAGVDLVCIGSPYNGYDDEAGYLEVRAALLAALADGTLSRDRLADAGRRVAELAAWVRDAGTDAPAAGTDAGHEVVRRIVDVVGDVRGTRGVHVVDLTGTVSPAAERLREPRLVTALRTLGADVTTGPSPDAPADRRVVAVVAGPSAEFDALRAARPDAVAVHVGLPDGWRPAGPSLTVWGDGRAQADVAAELLTGSARSERWDGDGHEHERRA